MMQHTTRSLFMLPKRVALCVLAGILAVTLMPFAPVESAYATPLEEKEAEAAQVLSNLNAMQNELDRLSAEYGEALAAQEEAEANRDAAQARIEEINEQITDLQKRLSERAREMYRTGNTTFLDILLGAQSFEDFAIGWDMVNKVNQNDVDMVNEQRALKVEQEEQAAVFDEQAHVAAQKADEASAAAESAAATVGEMQAVYDGLSEEVAQLVEEQRAAEEAAQAAANAALFDDSGYTAADASSYFGTEPTTSGGGAAASEPAYEGGSDVVSRAYACLGAPYVWGAVGPGGYDCSGLVSYCLSGSHIRLGTTGTFINWPRVSDPQPGDVCVIHQSYGSQHTGIYIGNGQMIHAATYGVGVIIGPVQSGMIIVRQP